MQSHYAGGAAARYVRALASPTPMRALPLALALLAAAAAAQPGLEAPADTAVVEVVLDDGTRFVGTVVSETAGALVIDTGAARVTVDPARVVERRVLRGRVGGRAVRDDPNRSRLLFAPTARPVGAGNGYFADYQVFFPFVGVGATEAVTVAGGISLFPTTELQLLYAAPKVTVVQGERAQVAVGAIGVVPLGADAGDGAGLVYGVGTVGSAQRAVTAGAGFGFATGGGQVGVGLVGLESQVSNHVKLLSENYVLATPSTVFVCTAGAGCVEESDGLDVTALLSGGVRFFNETLAADLAAFVVPELLDEGLPFVPWVGFAYNF